MKERYNERPQETWLEVLNKVPGGSAIAHFCEDIEEKQDEDGNAHFEANHYMVETPYRDGLEDAIKDNRAVWMAAAKEKAATEESKTLKMRVSDLEARATERDQLIDDLIVAQLGE